MKTEDCEIIKEYVYYDDTSPTFLRWKVDVGTNGHIKKDSVAGYKPKKSNSYCVVSINGEYYRIHRIVWALFNKEVDTNLAVDHIDRDKTNNAIDNLRLVSHSVNSRNRGGRITDNKMRNISKKKLGIL